MTTPGYTNKYIVAIGASAGGLEAIHEFFDHMPQSASFSFVVIQHLSSDFKSLLVELVAKHTHMKVFEAAQDMTIHQDCVYIIPNNKLMTIEKGRLKLADKALIKAPNTAIDTFLYSLAKDKKNRAIAIILSGTGTDGTKGIEEIKAQGGLVIAQDPGTAKFDGMPNSAIASGLVDYILPAREMNQELFNYVNEEPIHVLHNGHIDTVLLEEIFELVHLQSGNNFNLYKTPTIIRRITRRMMEKGTKELSDYVDLLKKDNAEVKILGQDFLIGVTSFFRDPQAYEVLENKILPELILQKQDDDLIKIWVCACSTGQEAYSLAILMNHCLERAGKKIEVKIFATDIDEKSIEIAARNQYPESIKKDVPPHFLEKYFVLEGEHYSVVSHIRKQVVFATHDIIKSPPFIKNDLITCRNMLIYMNAPLQDKILYNFHFSLNQGGFLFLGTSESALSLKTGVTEISGKWKIYQKTGPINYSSFNTYRSGGGMQAYAGKIDHQAAEPRLSVAEKRFNKFITTNLGYVGVLIDNAYIIQDRVGNYKTFLSLPEESVTLNILKMVPKELSIMLNQALRKSWKTHTNTRINKIRFQRNEDLVYLDVSIQPPEHEGGHTMIVFREINADTIPDQQETMLRASLGPNQNNEYVYELEAELNETRSNLQHAVEEMETTNEELQSTNEELLSANEELQSGNEELQSLNEELHTLNTEHQMKIKELIELNDDLDNYFRSTDIGQVFLDASLFIRKFNPAAVSMVNLIEADIGRSIVHISTNIQADNLTGDIRQVLLTGHLIEKEVLLKSGNRSLMRIMPYIRKDKKSDGVVITFVDISRITELNNIITGVFNASLNAILAFTTIRNQEHVITDFKCISFNSAALELLHKTKEQLNEALLVKQLPELIGGQLFHKFIDLVDGGEVLQTEFSISGSDWFRLVAVKMADGFVATLTDVSHQKASEQKLKKNYNELIGVRENLKRLNADLELKVEERTTELTASEERFKQVSRATNDTIWDWNLVNNTMWRSENMENMFGYQDEQAEKNINFWFNKIHAEDKEQVKKSVYAAINNNEKTWSAQYRVLKADGTYATILDRGTIMHDDFKTPYRMVGSMVDITRLIEAETKLSSSERKFRKVFESNVIGMLFSNIETGAIENANQAFLNMIGYSQEELNQSGFLLKQLTPAAYGEITQHSLDLVRENGMCPPFEKQYIRKDGHHIDVMIGSALLDENNNREVVTFVINISEQKEAEKRRNELQKLIKKQQDEFYSIFKNAPALISIRRGPALVYEFVNNAFIAFYGEQDYLQKSSASINTEYANTEIPEFEQQVLQTGDTFVARAHHMTRKGPEEDEYRDYWFDFILTPVFNDQGLHDGIAFFGFDVTDLVKAQEATKELMHKKDEFMSIASHELKTPITSIRGFLQLAQKISAKENGNVHLQTFISKANRQLGNLTALVDDLLDVTKIQAGKMLFNYGTFNIKDLVNECVEDIQNTESYEINIDHLDDIEIYGDQHRVEQVVNNFLSNAIKYSPVSKKAILYTEIIGDEIKLTVKDFGVGIPADKTELVFDRFFRVQDSAYQFSGLGLGLYISAEIVKRHGGRIGVDSVINEGSSFWFTLPIKQNEKGLDE